MGDVLVDGRDQLGHADEDAATQPFGQLAFGLCDLGMGEPELGYVSLTELRAVRGKIGLPVERDEHFEADKTLST
jgi:hypothetical protein